MTLTLKKKKNGPSYYNLTLNKSGGATEYRPDIDTHIKRENLNLWMKRIRCFSEIRINNR